MKTLIKFLLLSLTFAYVGGCASSKEADAAKWETTVRMEQPKPTPVPNECINPAPSRKAEKVEKKSGRTSGEAYIRATEYADDVRRLHNRCAKYWSRAR